MSNDKLQKFEDQPIRTVWDEEVEEWYFSVVDVVSVLTDQAMFLTRFDQDPLRWALDRESCSPLQRTHLPPMTDDSHVCELKGIFPDVHAAEENKPKFSLRLRAQTLRGFFDCL